MGTWRQWFCSIVSLSSDLRRLENISTTYQMYSLPCGGVHEALVWPVHEQLSGHSAWWRGGCARRTCLQLRNHSGRFQGRASSAVRRWCYDGRSHAQDPHTCKKLLDRFEQTPTGGKPPCYYMEGGRRNHHGDASLKLMISCWAAKKNYTQSIL